jgi:hypothetical protein
MIKNGSNGNYLFYLQNAAYSSVKNLYPNSDGVAGCVLGNVDLTVGNFSCNKPVGDQLLR